jgi:hypothetical protein
MEAATGVPRRGYAVSIPPFDQGDPKTSNSGSVPDPELLGYLNVGYIIADYPLLSEQLEFEANQSGTWIYRNLAVKPRAFVVEESALRPAEVLTEGANSRTVQGQGPGRLYLSESAYPGWIARVDGQKSPLIDDELPILAVDLEPGIHIVQFLFRPVDVYIGLIITLGTIVLLGFLSRGVMIDIIGNCNASER